jgi:hypothetical protein
MYLEAEVIFRDFYERNHVSGCRFRMLAAAAPYSRSHGKFRGEYKQDQPYGHLFSSLFSLLSSLFSLFSNQDLKFATRHLKGCRRQLGGY